jgi:glycosyltransferase involved in cell wall biosynthesis
MYRCLNPFVHEVETPIHIAFGITDLDVGGAENSLVTLATRLNRSRWTPSVVCLQPEGPLAETIRKADIDVLSLNVHSWRDVGPGLLRWRRELQTKKPAILQTFLFHANLLGRMAAWMSRVPIHVSGVRVAERRAKGHLLADRLTHRMSGVHVCVSRATAEFQIAAAGVPRSRVEVIPNGIDVENATTVSGDVDESNQWGAKSAAKLAFVGRLDHQKGIDLLLEALGQLPAEKRPSIALVGAGPDRESLEEQTKQLDLDELVHFVGWQSNPSAWMAAADALVLPSRWEGMPNVVLEAMSVGKPVIAANVEGVADLVEDGVTGWITEPNNPSSLAVAVSRFLADRHRWTEMGAAARRKVSEEFSMDRVVERYERLWLQLLERHRLRRRPISHHVVADYRR